jgi:chromosome segregation protein
VDPSALLELQDWEERFTFLESQKKDLWEAKEMLCQALADMDRQARDRLGQALGRLQVEFQELCRRLMGGGEGSLELVGSEDILEAGLEVRVRPPGKQLRTLALLSGGERALSALAFLFALHRVRPSPLCLLDEVDAPLDDANVERLLGVLRELGGESQFLMVTHHPRSVAEADAVLGITMGEEGISTVLGLPWDRFGAREK